jgi:hypothetical protein
VRAGVDGDGDDRSDDQAGRRATNPTMTRNTASRRASKRAVLMFYHMGLGYSVPGSAKPPNL